ncbi:DEKNAAC105354 [Brettanomyces naardenensis]|uniref:tRNA-5-taurinomethyluridine 2-sulfurtransferase n=1 Tax=Brettanomyces naardenensis TaxID=13370 RepID=A0A448YT73_BRENA|nr:DEKNAAC105354 [Brettanomyces naardenensis]
MSSGVDSSVSALMYAQKYKNVRGIFMANWSSSADGHVGASCSRDDGSKGKNASCTADRDWDEVQATCQQLGIPCERVSFEKEYWIDVFEPMLDLYQRGLTPNPDVGCNRYIKFGKMIEHLERYYDRGNKWWLVTGHYAKILRNDETGESQLFRADYRQKDQSYYLSQIRKSVLSRVLLPMGHYTKPEVRKIAQSYGLVTKDKPDSQGLCFVSPQVKFGDFLDEYLEPNPGNIVDKDGKIWGRHRGLWHGTIGQRCGVSMPQGDDRYKGVWLICGKNIEKNELVIARKDDEAAFKKDVIVVSDWKWMNEREALVGDQLNAQIRSLQKPVGVRGVDLDGEEMVVRLEEELFGVAAGQDLVLYDGDRVIGCGMIAGARREVRNASVLKEGREEPREDLDIQMC